MIEKKLAAVAALTLLAACTTELSALDGRLFSRVDPKMLSVVITKVDGSSTIGNPVMVDAGTHKVTVAAPPARPGVPGSASIEREFEITVGRCERVYLAARRESPLLDEFAPQVVERAPLGGCTASAATSQLKG